MTENTGREYPLRPLIGVGAIVVGNKGVVLIKRGKPPRLGSWSLPGGAQKIGETVNEAARREIKEETGLDVEVQGLVDVVDSISPAEKDGRIRYHYTLVDVWATANGNHDPVAGGDAADARWVSLDMLDELELWSETRRVIERAHFLWLGA